MKTSRVSATTYSTYHHEHRPVHQVNDSAYQPGEQYRHRQQSGKSFKHQFVSEKDIQEATTLTVEPEHSIYVEKELDNKIKSSQPLTNKKICIQKYISSI